MSRRRVYLAKLHDRLICGPFGREAERSAEQPQVVAAQKALLAAVLRTLRLDVGLHHSPHVVGQSPLDNDAIQTVPRPLPAPAILRARRIRFDVLCRSHGRQGLTAVGTSGTRTRLESTTALTWCKALLNFHCDPLMPLDLNLARNHICIKERRQAALRAISVRRLIESVVDKVIAKVSLAVLAPPNVLFACHRRITYKNVSAVCPNQHRQSTCSGPTHRAAGRPLR